MAAVIQTATWEQVQHARAERDEAWRLASTWEQSAEDAMRALHDANAKAAALQGLAVEILREYKHVTRFDRTPDDNTRIAQWIERAGLDAS